MVKGGIRQEVGADGRLAELVDPAWLAAKGEKEPGAVRDKRRWCVRERSTPGQVRHGARSFKARALEGKRPYLVMIKPVGAVALNGPVGFTGSLPPTKWR